MTLRQPAKRKDSRPRSFVVGTRAGTGCACPAIELGITENPGSVEVSAYPPTPAAGVMAQHPLDRDAFAARFDGLPREVRGVVAWEHCSDRPG
jgi:hypothetical protein